MRSWIGVAPLGGPAEHDIRPLLRHWGIDAFKITRSTRGAAGAHLFVEARSERYVLREFAIDRAYLEFKLRVIAHLGGSGFPYDVPRIVPTTDAAKYVTAGSHWILYRFVEGTHAAPLATMPRARSLGRLVASYDRALETLDLADIRGQFRLPLFDVEYVAGALTDATPCLRERRDRSGLGAVFAEHAVAMLATLRAVSRAPSAAVAELPAIAAYNDWHRFNLIDRDGDLAGLIDYDSVVEAPRIVDVQNALTYVLLSKKTPDLRLMSSFFEGYAEVVALSRRETSLVYPVWLDRIAWLVADIVDEVRRAGASTREPIACGLLRLFSWLTTHQRECSDLASAPT